MAGKGWGGPAKGAGTGGPAQGEGEGGPAREFTWQVTAGNALALAHGAYSPRTINNDRTLILAQLAEERPDLLAFGWAVKAWATAEAIADRLVWRLDLGDVAEGVEPRESLLRHVDRALARAERAREKLGLDPTSAARLAKERADALKGAYDLEELRARGFAALRARGFDLEG